MNLKYIILILIAIPILVIGLFFILSGDGSFIWSEDDGDVVPGEKSGGGYGDEDVFCTADVKQCPDGSYVSRVGPDCEFEECPTVGEDNEDVDDEDVGCPEDAKICDDGSVVVRSGENCEFEECPTDGSGGTGISGKHYCQPSERGVDVCIEIYSPVCGWNDPDKIVCVTYPCASSYSNSCFACLNPEILYWTEGDCPSPVGSSKCTESDCGPQLGMPNYLCSDGVTVAGPGECKELEGGRCGWEIVSCPE
jgi:hypothetical protein